MSGYFVTLELLVAETRIFVDDSQVSPSIRRTPRGANESAVSLAPAMS